MSEQAKKIKLNPQPLSSSRSVSPYRSIMAAFFIALIGFFGGQALAQRSTISSFSQAVGQAEQGKLSCGKTTQIPIKLLCSPVPDPKGIAIQGSVLNSNKTSFKIGTSNRKTTLIKLNSQTKIFTSSTSKIIASGEKVFVIKEPKTNFAKFVFVLN